MLPASTAWKVFGLFALMILVHASGFFGIISYAPIIVTGGASVLIGLRVHRPDLRWPWITMLVGSLMLAVAVGHLAIAHLAVGNLAVGQLQVPPAVMQAPHLVLVGALSAAALHPSPHRRAQALRRYRRSRDRHSADESSRLRGPDAIVERVGRLLDAGHHVGLIAVTVEPLRLGSTALGHSTTAVTDSVVDRMAAQVGPEAMIGRLTDETFFVITDGLDGARLGALTERLQLLACEPFAIGEVSIGEAFIGEAFVDASFGWALSALEPPQAGRRMRKRSAHATELLQQAIGGREAIDTPRSSDHTPCVSPSPTSSSPSRCNPSAKGRLDEALTNQQLSVAFQPIVTAPTGAISGFEALARWPHAGRSVSPAEFIAVAETSGLIIPLGAFVLDEACRQVASWRRRAGAGSVEVSVNISARQVISGDIVNTVAECLNRHSLHGNAVWLEISERTVLADPRAANSLMMGIRSLGVRVAIDDVGAQCSSLPYLKRFPVTRVKLWAGHHRRAATASNDVFLASMINSAHSVGIETVAVGVESRAQAAHLIGLGCNQVQGFLFSPPVIASEVPDLLAIHGAATPEATSTRRQPAMSVGF